MTNNLSKNVNNAKETFEKLKEQSFISGKNIASISNVAKVGRFSRNNFYKEDAGKGWLTLKDNILTFEKHFESLSKGKYKNPQITKYKEESKNAEKDLIKLAEQNLELLERINNFENIIKDKDNEISLLHQNLSNYYKNKEEF